MRAYLVVEGESLSPLQARVGQLDHLQPVAQQHHLTVQLVQEDHAAHPRHARPAGPQQVLGHGLVAHAGDQRARVDQRMEGRLRL